MHYKDVDSRGERNRGASYLYANQSMLDVCSYGLALAIQMASRDRSYEGL